MTDREPGRQAEPLSTVRPTRIITYAWGEKYVDALLSLALPADRKSVV